MNTSTAPDPLPQGPVLKPPLDVNQSLPHRNRAAPTNAKFQNRQRRPVSISANNRNRQRLG